MSDSTSRLILQAASHVRRPDRIIALGLPVKVSCWLLLCGAIGITGCVTTEYEIQLRPDGNHIERTLRVRTGVTEGEGNSSPLAADEIARLHAFYDPAHDKLDDGWHEFSGRFQDEMPADVGGAGRYTHLISPLGSTSYYSERFRGEDDLVKSISHREQAIDNIITLLQHWVSSEITDPVFAERVNSFLAQDLRRDLKNVALYCWTHAMLSDLDEEKTLERLTARLLQYAVERDYVEMSDIPRVARILHSPVEQSKVDLLREILLRKLQSNDPNALSILKDHKKFETSLRQSIRETELYRDALAQYQRENKLSDAEVAETEPLDPIGLLTSYAFQATLPNMVGKRVTVTVTLQCETPPFVTNAKWVQEDQAARWKASIDTTNVPAFVFVGWSTPDETAQIEHFGGVLLSGELLARFIVWYHGLDTDEIRQFDGFLNGLQPENDLKEQFEEFEFSDEQDESLGERGKSILLESLEDR